MLSSKVTQLRKMKTLHIVLLPMTAPGHIIPMLDMAKLFSSRGIQTTIICPLAYADPILKARESGLHITHAVIDFPPEGCEVPDHMTTPDWFQQFIKALAMLQQHVDKLLLEIRPDAIVSDPFMHWSVDSAAKLGIPRLVFNSSGYLPICCHESMRSYKPYSKHSDPFVLPNLPHEFTFLRSQVPEFELHHVEEENTKDQGNVVPNWLMKMTEADDRSYGAIFNTFYDLDPVYADYWRNANSGRKAWDIGPLFISSIEEKEVPEHACLAWLDSRTTYDSVVYICFGSSSSFTTAQLTETAIGLEASGQDFIWVVGKKDCENEDWLPQGFEKRIQSKGMIVRGWAPQRSILRHPKVGAFLTHCGWNSLIEGVCAGLPMVTWPISAEQFYNEKLVIELMRTGVLVGSKKWTQVASDGVSSEAIAKAVKDVMLREDSVEMRMRARNYKDLMENAVKEGGSSYCSLTHLMEELGNYPKVH